MKKIVKKKTRIKVRNSATGTTRDCVSRAHNDSFSLVAHDERFS